MVDLKKVNSCKQGMAKNKTLIFCFDGMCKDPEDARKRAENEEITNIKKLYERFKDCSCDESTSQNNKNLCQQSFYYLCARTRAGWFRKFLNMFCSPENGDDERILNTAITDLQKHPQKDNYLLVFGFSRGAALARRFASVAKKRSEVEGFKINFLGVFDTVAAISGTDSDAGTKPTCDVVFKDGEMSRDVLKAVHLVALDENRITFQPALFDYDPKKRITEVWFPGLHADVGGGYQDASLSDLALEYMIEKVKQECKEHVRIPESGDIPCKRLNDKKCERITQVHMKSNPSVDKILHEHKRGKTGITAVITAVITAGLTGGLIVGFVAGVITGLLAGAMAGAMAGLISGSIAVGIADVMAGLTAGIIAGATAGATAGVIVGMIVSVIVGVIVGKKVYKKIRKKRLHPREVRIAGDHPECKHPMVHESVQLRYKEVEGYRPHALRDVKYAVTGHCRQLSGEEQKTTGLKYKVTADDKQVGDVRQGASGLWEE